MLVVDGVRKRLGGRVVLDEAGFECDAGQVIAIAGANGAGKTTLLRIIAGVIEPDRGIVEIDGESIVGSRMKARRKLGYVPEAADPPGHLEVRELLDLVAALKSVPPLAADVRAGLGVDELARQRIERLSLGERRRACLAAALVGDPVLLVMDEPSNGLDAPGLEHLVDILRTRRDAGCAIVVATHDHEFTDALADARLRLVAGRLEPAPSPSGRGLG